MDSRDEYAKAIQSYVEKHMNQEYTWEKFAGFIPELLKIRTSHMYGFEKELQKYLTEDGRTVLTEYNKYKEIGSATKRPLSGFFTKTKEATNARMSAHICL